MKDLKKLITEDSIKGDLILYNSKKEDYYIYKIDEDRFFMYSKKRAEIVLNGGFSPFTINHIFYNEYNLEQLLVQLKNDELLLRMEDIAEKVTFTIDGKDVANI